MNDFPTPMRLGVMFVNTYLFMRAHLAATVGIGALLATLDATISGVANTAAGDAARSLGEVFSAQQNVSISTDTIEQVTTALPWIALTLLISFLTQLAATGVMTLAVVRERRAETVQPAELWRGVPWARLLGVNALILGLMLVAAVGPALVAVAVNSFVFVAIAMVIATTIVIAIGTALAVPAMINEQLAVVPALQRSFTLVRNRWFRVAWVLVVANLLWSFIGSIISSPIAGLLGLLAGGSGSAFGDALRAITSSIVTGAIALPGIAITTTLIYFSRAEDQ